MALVCSSPQLFAAYRVLLRLLESRHPPYALCCFKKLYSFVFSIRSLFQRPCCPTQSSALTSPKGYIRFSLCVRMFVCVCVFDKDQRFQRTFLEKKAPTLLLKAEGSIVLEFLFAICQRT